MKFRCVDLAELQYGHNSGCAMNDISNIITIKDEYYSIFMHILLTSAFQINILFVYNIIMCKLTLQVQLNTFTSEVDCTQCFQRV